MNASTKIIKQTNKQTVIIIILMFSSFSLLREVLNEVIYFFFVQIMIIIFPGKDDNKRGLPPLIEMEDNGEAALAEADVFVCENDAISLVCRVGGWPEPRLIFYKDGKRLRPNENVSLGKCGLTFKYLEILSCEQLNSL